MSQVTLNLPAPDFKLDDYNGKPVSLSDFREKNGVMLVFNRGFM